MDHEYPSFDDIFSTSFPTIKRIPVCARQAVGRVLLGILQSIVFQESIIAWKKLFMFPKCILYCNQRRGRSFKPSDIRKLCELWDTGHELELWNNVISRSIAYSKKVSKTSSCQQLLDRRRVSIATALAEERLFGKACRMLTSSGIAANNEETWELLKAKHPYVPIPSHPTNIPPHSSVDLLPSDFNIRAVLLSFPKDTSCGPSGLRVQHLLDASEASLPSSLLSAFKAVINKLASGRALPEIAEYLAGATVIALKKPGGNDIRPIAVGEVLRRLTSKCLCAIVKYKASEFFNPYQYGIVCPIHCVQVLMIIGLMKILMLPKLTYEMHLTWCLEMLC